MGWVKPKTCPVFARVENKSTLGLHSIYIFLHHFVFVLRATRQSCQIGGIRQSCVLHVGASPDSCQCSLQAFTRFWHCAANLQTATVLHSNDVAGDGDVDEASVDGVGEAANEHALFCPVRCRLGVDRTYDEHRESTKRSP